jgi:hypothetical protein
MQIAEGSCNLCWKNCTANDGSKVPFGGGRVYGNGYFNASPIEACETRQTELYKAQNKLLPLEPHVASSNV